MKEFFEDFTLILGFLILILVVQISMGDDIAQKFLIIILLSVLVINFDKFNNFLSTIFSKGE